MRVIGGSARGRTLKGPPRPRASGRPGVRPTSDLVRGAIFDMLDAMGADYGRVLDLYAGTGALGIEALSRGDGTADFVESDAEAAATLAANLRITGFEARGTLHRLTAERAASRLSGPYTLVLADPPYYDEGALAIVQAIAVSPLVDADTVFVLEHHQKAPPPETLGGLPMYRSRRHGDTVVSIYAGEVVT
ncbi:MAG: RsmD family RNA methyltransferase [Chloroflexi bacterium]|nr:RsmD family RNA methyltransferase [Chloroflexota bacterium]